ncbi:hypothetical protein STAS_19541 [Striga asiatica]|uniref:TOD1/MUCI70 glycosyltransferase-like domain-containing protein n=1 Tax=Striga asiatica TaxID=4170 RepID=A0A5A7QC06_STRAF|nr:hypothetical protein STAS_19541 [Striga asiatica]
MGKLATFSKPLIFQSKLLCFSLIYLFSALSLAVYFTFSATKCVFRWSPSEPFQAPLFLYPSSYGEHKHAIPTTRNSCNSPVYFSDRISMEKCRGLVVASAIFNDHDKIRQPKGLGSKTLDHTCFFMFVDDATLNRLHYHKMITKTSKAFKIGAWRIVNVSSELLYESPAMNGIIPKYLIHRLFPNSKYSVWVDAKMQLVVDPFLLIHSLVVEENADMAISRHPYFSHTMEEAMATARWKKWWDVNGLKVQMETYCENGLTPWSPNKTYPTDVPDSAIILRKHTMPTNLFSCLLFNELEAFNPRDQLPFAFVRDKIIPKLKLNMFEVEVFEHVAVEYRHNIVPGWAGSGPRTKMASPDLFGNTSCGKCEGYLLGMWGESHD